MKSKTLSMLLFAVVTSQLRAQEYEIKLEADGEEIAIVELSIKSEAATAKVGDITEHFDLMQQRWQHDELKQWVTSLSAKRPTAT
jgi:hypothetical protein